MEQRMHLETQWFSLLRHEPQLPHADSTLNDVTTTGGYSQYDLDSMKREMYLMAEENRRLVEEVRGLMSATTNLSDLPVTDDDTPDTDSVVIENLQRQIRAALEEKDAAVEMWRSACREVEKLQAELQTQRDNQSWKVVEKRATEVENQYLQAVNQIESDLRIMSKELSVKKQELVESVQIQDEQEKIIEAFKTELNQKDRDFEQLRDKCTEYESRITANKERCISIENEKSQLASRLSSLQKQLVDFQSRQHRSEENEQVAQSRVKDSIQVMEKARLERDQAVQKLKLQEEAFEQLEKRVTKLLDEEGARVRAEVDNVRKQSNLNIEKLMDEVHALEVQCSEKDNKYDRLQREKKSILAMLDEVTKTSKEQGDNNKQTINDLNTRLTDAERRRDELNLKLETANHSTQLQKINHTQEMNKKDDIIKQMKINLKYRHQELDRLNKEQENSQTEVDNIKKKLQSALSEKQIAIHQHKIQLTATAQDQSLAVQQLTVKLRATEDHHTQALAENRKLISSQQQMAAKLNEECQSIARKLEQQITERNDQISDLKQRNRELTSLLRDSQHKTEQTEKMLSNFTRKYERLEARVQDAESQKSTIKPTVRFWSTERDSIIKSLQVTPSDTVNILYKMNE